MLPVEGTAYAGFRNHVQQVSVKLYCINKFSKSLRSTLWYALVRNDNALTILVIQGLLRHLSHASKFGIMQFFEYSWSLNILCYSKYFS